MTKKQFIANLVLCVPLLVINFFVYGINGCVDFINDMKTYSKELFK